MIDGILGTEDFRTGTWQGYFDTDLEAIVELGKIKMIDNLQISFLKDQRSWIFLPKEIQIYTSIDGKKYANHITWQFPNPKNEEKVAIEKLAISKLGKARFVKIIAKKIGKLPEWHLGFQDDGRSWLFVDEIQIK